MVCIFLRIVLFVFRFFHEDDIHSKSYIISYLRHKFKTNQRKKGKRIPYQLYKGIQSLDL
jgi:hypothetical protein